MQLEYVHMGINIIVIVIIVIIIIISSPSIGPSIAIKLRYLAARWCFSFWYHAILAI